MNDILLHGFLMIFHDKSMFEEGFKNHAFLFVFSQLTKMRMFLEAKSMGQPPGMASSSDGVPWQAQTE